MRPHRQKPTRLPRPWDSPGKNTGVACHFLLQCVKVKSESEVAQSCPTLSDPMDYSLPGSSIHGFPGQSLRKKEELGRFQLNTSCPQHEATFACTLGLSSGQIYFCSFSLQGVAFWNQVDNEEGSQGQSAPWAIASSFSRCCSVSVLSDSLQPRGHQASLSFTISQSLLKLMYIWWCYPTILSLVSPFSSCPQSFPASGSCSMSRLFPSGGQSIGASALASVLSINIQGWFPLGLTGLLSLLSKGF